MKDDITHASIIPLVGGMTMGVTKALGRKPEFVSSYGPFRRNERHLHEYYPDVPAYDLDVPYWRNMIEKMGGNGSGPDIISTVCPCAGLSITSSQSKNHGAGSTHNAWMYRTAEFVLGKLKPKVMFGENAPALFGHKGEPVANLISEIGKKHGYSFSMIYTNSRLHGLPQNRPRTFYFLWRSPTAPKFRVIRKPIIGVADFMRQVEYSNVGAYERQEFCRMPLVDDIFYQYAVQKWGESWRAECDGRTIIDQVRRDDLSNDLFSWADAHAKDHPQFDDISRMRANSGEGRGVWDDSPKVVSDFTPAVMFKNIKRIVHPIEERFLNVRELLALMGFPKDFNLFVDPDKPPETALEEAMHHITQNVPVSTAADMGTYIKDVLEHRLALSDTDYYLFDNTKGMRIKRAVHAEVPEGYENG